MINVTNAKINEGSLPKNLSSFAPYDKSKEWRFEVKKYIESRGFFDEGFD